MNEQALKELDQLCDAVDAARVVSSVIHRAYDSCGHPFDNLTLTEDEVDELHIEALEVLVALGEAGFLGARLDLEELKRAAAERWR